MMRPRHLRLVPSAMQATMPTDARPAPAPRKKRPPLRPARPAAAIRGSLRRIIAAQAATVDACIASVRSDAKGHVDKLEQQQRAMAAQINALRESLRREHNGMRWKKGMSYDEN